MRPLRLAAAFVVIAALAIGAFAWVEAARGRHAGPEAQARSLARVLAAGAVDAVGTVERAERAVAGRLEATARWADGMLASSHRARQDVLAEVARSGRLAWAALVEPGGPAVVVRWPPPVPAEDGAAPLSPSEEAEAAAAARALATRPGEAKVEGLTHANAFGAPTERFGVALGREDGGTILLRARAEEMAEVRRRFGLDPAIERVASVPGVERVALLDGGHGTTVPGSVSPGPVAPPLGRVPDAETVRDSPGEVTAIVPFVVPDDPTRRAVSVTLSTASADAALARTRRTIAVAAGTVVLVTIAAALALAAVERRHARQRAGLEARREEDRRLADLGAVASLVTHEISNPLNAIRLGLHLLDAPPGAEAGTPPPAGLPATLRAEADRMAATMESVLALARARRTGLERVDAGVLALAASRIAGESSARRVRVSTDAEDGAPAAAAGDPVVVEQALASVLRNAVQASPDGGRVRARWRAAEGGGVRITVEDEGPGFPKEGRDGLLRLGGAGRAGGHGLGLALARRFVEAEGGRVALLDAPGGGALVEIALPAARAGTP